MSSLITPALRSEISTAMKTIFDTFSKGSVTFYKVSSTEVVAFDPNYNSDFGYPNSITPTTQSQSFTCRINYLDRQDYDTFMPGGEDAGVKGKFFYSRIKLRMEADAFAYLAGVERFEFSGEKYQIEESYRRTGPFDQFLYYQVILRRIN